MPEGSLRLAGHHVGAEDDGGRAEHGLQRPVGLLHVEEERPDDDDLEIYLPDWEQLKAWASEAYSLDDDQGDAFSITMTWSATPRKQVVTIERGADGGEEWVTFRSGICRRGRLSSDAALRKSAELGFAKIVNGKDRFDIAYTYPLTELTAARFAHLFERIAELADDLEQELTRGGDEF